MTRRCSDTHFWAEGIKIPSGMATYEYKGEVFRVVCGRHSPKPGEIHVKAIRNAGVISLEVPSVQDHDEPVSISVRVKKDRLSGKKGRVDIDKRFYKIENGLDGLLFTFSQVSEEGADYKAVVDRLWLYMDQLSEQDQLRILPSYVNRNYVLNHIRQETNSRQVRDVAIGLINSPETLLSLARTTTGDVQDRVINRLTSAPALAEELRLMGNVAWYRTTEGTKEKILHRLGELLDAEVTSSTEASPGVEEMCRQISYAVQLSHNVMYRHEHPFEEDVTATRDTLAKTSNWLVRRYLADTTDEAIQRKLAITDSNPTVRAQAIRHLDADQGLLYQTILAEPAESVRAVGAGCLDDLDKIETLLWNDPSDRVRLAAADSLKYRAPYPGDTSGGEVNLALAKVLRSHPDQLVRLHAARYIRDIATRLPFAYTDPAPDVRLSCLRGVKDQAVLENIAMSDPSEQVVLALLPRLTSPAIFTTLVTSSPLPTIRRRALKYADDDLRISAAIASNDKTLRRYALKCVQSQQRLIDLRRDAPDEELVQMAGALLPQRLLMAHLDAAL